MMRLAKLALLGALFVLLSGLSSTQRTVLFSGKATYQGPGDVVASAKTWIGLRAYSAADRGNPLINICDPTNAICVNWNSDPTTGKLVATSNPINGTDCTVANTCTIKTWYDRSGAISCTTACDFTQNTAANRATLKWNCVNSLPCGVLNGTSAVYATPAVSAVYNTPYSMALVTIRTAVFTTGNVLTGSQANTPTFSFNGANQIFVAGAGGVSVSSISDSNYHAFSFHIDTGGNGNLRCTGSAGVNCSVPGTNNIIAPGTAAGTATASALGGIFGANFLSGQFTEGGWWNLQFTTIQEASLNSNAYSYWGPF